MRIIRATAPIRIADGSQAQVGTRNTKFDKQKLSGVITKLLEEHFDNIDIVDVVVSPDRDRDGDEILRVEVVFNGDLKGSEVAAASRYIGPAISEVNEDLYPLLSFVSKVDYDRGHKSEAR